MREEEAGGGGNGTVWVDGGKLTRGGAAFVNAEMQLAGGKWDTYRMLTHPGVMIMPAAMVACEATGASGKDYITGIVCGYEVLERIARDFVPQIMSQGFHTAPVIGIIGAAVAAAKIYGFDEDRINGAIAQCANFAAGNLESGRSGGSRLPRAALYATLCWRWPWRARYVPPARPCSKATPASSRPTPATTRGELDYHFEGQLHANIAYIAEGLGTRYEFLNTIYRLYGVGGLQHRPHRHGGRPGARQRHQGATTSTASKPSSTATRRSTPARPSLRRPATTSRASAAPTTSRAWSALGPGYPLVDPKREGRPGRHAGADEPRHVDPVRHADAVRAGSDHLHQGRQEVHQEGDGPRVHLGLRQRSAPAQRRAVRPADIGRRSSMR